MTLTLLKNNHYSVAGEPIYEYVRRMRKLRGWSIAKLAAEAGCDHASIHRFEAGSNRSLKLAISLLEGLGFTVVIDVTKPGR